MMYYDYHYASDGEEVIGIILFYIIYAVFGGGLGVALYVLRSMGVYAIAKRRGLNRAWMAWVPVVDYYLLGCLSDQYRYVVKGQNKSKRKWLLGLNIVLFALSAVMVAMMLGMIVSVAGAAINGASENRIARQAISSMLSVLGTSLPLMGVSIAVLVLRYMALYDVYTSCDPRNSTMYLVLSIFFNVTEPFFLFFNRKKDDGMPPRRQDPPAYNPEPPVYEAPKEETWTTE